jgi:uncharacterized protein (DUF1800 family)
MFNKETSFRSVLRLSVPNVLVIGLMSLTAGCGWVGSSNTPSTASGSSTPTDGITADASTAPSQSANPNASPAGAVLIATAPAPVIAGLSQVAAKSAPTSENDAFRLLQQATFGPTEESIREVQLKGARTWIKEQMALPISQFSGRDRDQGSKWDSVYGFDYCRTLLDSNPYKAICGDQYISSNSVRRDFFKHATAGADQLRQRVTFALSQILVISENDLPSAATYGLADYYQLLRDKSFASYPELLKAVTLHPMMGRYLGMVNNDKQAPNENYGRELLQLFSLGTCDLNQDGTLKGNACIPTYDNAVVREYSYALTGFTYPKGGNYPGNLYGWNTPYARGAMEPVAEYHDTNSRKLLSGVQTVAGSSAEQSLAAVISSISMHPNLAPFISKQLIQALVTSNPSSAYVQRISAVFDAGKFDEFGEGKKGDLSAVVAAILLDPEARMGADKSPTNYGMLRDPIIKMTSAVRALNGISDGEDMGMSWRSAGQAIGQPFLNSPTVFNFFRPEFNLPGSTMNLAPQFQILTPNSILGWMNLADDILYGWDLDGKGLAPKANIPDAVGTKLKYASFEADASDTQRLFNRLSLVLTGSSVTGTDRAVVTNAMEQITSTSPVPAGSSWQREKIKVGAYLLLSSVNFQIQR